MSGDNPFKMPFRQRFQEIPEEDILPYLYEADSGIPNSVPPEHYVNFDLAPGEHLIQCPYEKSHRILPSRMANHIDRCRNNHKAKLHAQGLSERFINCPWNEFHIIPEIEGSYHSAQCTSRHKSKREELEDIKRFAPKDKMVCPPELAHETEDWGTDPPRYLAYDPMRKVKEEPVFYQPRGLSRSAKVKHREEQRLKFYHLVSGPFWEGYQSSLSRLEENRTREKEKSLSAQVEKAVAAKIPALGPAIFVDKPFASGRLDLRLEENSEADSDTRNWVEGNFSRGGLIKRSRSKSEERK